MSLKKDMMLALVEAVSKDQRPDVLWCVTSFRTDVYCMFKNFGLSRPGGKFDPVTYDRQLVADILCDYANILSTFPAELKYNDDKIETPRLDALSRTFDVVEGLTSDSDSWSSVQELARLVATNSDTDRAKLDYAVLMGIVLKICELLEIDIVQMCDLCIKNLKAGN